MKYYKVLGRGGVPCNGGSGQWSLPHDGNPGDWMPEIDDIKPCERGYHLCEREDILGWINAEIYEAEGRGKYIRDTNKTVFSEARLIKKLNSWDEKTIRLFAADCSEHVLHFFEDRCPNDDRPRKAIQASRDFAKGTITDEAWAVAWSAARAAAWAVAWAAARAAVWAAAWAAARAAARDEARDEAWDEAWTAENNWQTERLFFYLEVPS
jgi:hypothetical protein